MNDVSWLPKFFVITIACFITFGASFGFAGEAGSFKSLHYKPSKQIPDHNAPELARISRFVESQGLYDISKSMKSFRERFGLDQIYVSNDLSQALFLRFDLQLAEGAEVGNIVGDGKGSYVAHGKTKLGTSYTALFIGYSKPSINPLLLGLQKELPLLQPKKRHNVGLFDLLLPQAFAADSPGAPGEKPTCRSNSILDRGWGEFFKALGWQCAFEAVAAGKVLPFAAKWGKSGLVFEFWDTAGDEKILAGLQSGINGEFLDEATKMFRSFIANLLDIRNVLASSVRGIDYLSDEDQMAVWCRLVGLGAATTASAALITGASGGVAAPAALVGATAVIELAGQVAGIKEKLDKVRRECSLDESFKGPESNSKWVDPPAKRKTRQ